MVAGRVAAPLFGLLALVLPSCSGDSVVVTTTSPRPNILFVIMDDVGIDQMQVFGYGGDTPPSTPNIDAIAGAGIRFHNVWAMPACTTSRAVFFDGRFPVRTNVFGALGPNDLANSQVSPYEMTVPKLLAPSGYESALFGKFHLGLQENNPAGYAMPHALGWNFFAGWLDFTGDPSSIDRTAGGVAPPGTWSCGFVPGASAGGADAGACYMADGTCGALSSSGPIPPGRTCRDRGGIFDPGKDCQAPPPTYLEFTTLSAHYVSPLVINNEDGSVEQVPPTDPRARHFRAAFAVDAAVHWIKDRPTHQPWMATVSFASPHTPVMQPPANALNAGEAESSKLDCADGVAQRVLTDLMIESLDTEVGRLLVETGLARRGGDGRLLYEPGKTETMIVIVGDNGTLGNAVKLPFNPQRAKGTAYQTGVWVPLIVAGPLVKRPDRVVSHMVNVADLFELFGEIAGLDVHETVPRPIDSVAMLPYLLDPNQASIRTTNFTQIGLNLQINGGVNGPCIIGTSCTQIPVSKTVCEDNNGVWYGADSGIDGVPPAGLARCCNVNAFLAANGQAQFAISPDYAAAIRNDHFKIVQNTTMEYQSQAAPCVNTVETEFYAIDEAVPIPLLDNPDRALPLASLTPEQQRNYDALAPQLAAILASAPACPGDGNIDSVVDQKDLDDWSIYAGSGGLSSVYDLNLDGVTNAADQTIIQENLGRDCQN
jgi:arylsulfatase A-like enzyme